MSRSDWTEPCYELRRPELVLLLGLAHGLIDRATFVAGLVALDWPEAGAAELGELIVALQAPRPAEVDPGAAVDRCERCERHREVAEVWCWTFGRLCCPTCTAALRASAAGGQGGDR